MQLVPRIRRSGTDSFLLFHKYIDKIIPVLKIIIHKDSCELISANTENGASTECRTDKVARILDVIVALFMPILVVDLFQVITVENGYGYAERLSVGDPGLNIIDIFGKGSFITDGSEGIGMSVIITIPSDMITKSE